MSSSVAPLPFAHLHLHSHYSLLDSTIQIPGLIEQVKELGMESVAITDHGNLFNAFPFVKAANAGGVRPVVGCEVYVAPGDHREKGAPGVGRKPYYHLVLLAENQEGYGNLTRLVSEAALEGFYYKPRISKELLSQYSGGLIGLTACLSGEVPQRLMQRDAEGARRVAEEYREILGKDNFFLEIQNHGSVDEEFVREGLRDLGRLTDIPLVATNDCHFHRPEDVFAHRILIGIGQGNTISDLQQKYVYNGEFYVKSADEMYRLFEAFPGSCELTAEIAARCHVEFDTSTYHLPSFPIPEGDDERSYFRRIAREGLEARLAQPVVRKTAHEDYAARLEHEIGVIEEMGFPGYFLVVWDFIRHAKEKNIPVGPGRGSAAGSVVSYALGITDIDPLEYDLLFERFLNPERVSMPDIDIDFCQRGREEVIEYVRQRYGEESVCQIATFNILKAKSAIRDVGRVLEMQFGDVDRIAKLVPDELDITIEKALRDSAELKALVDGDEDVAQVVETARKLEGLARHCGVHAAGVVIAAEPLVNLVPLSRTNKEEVITQYDKDDVEALGLLKMDFLGLRTLTVIDDAVKSIRRTENPDLDLSILTLDDPAVFELFAAGDTDGVFQFESSGMKEVLRKVQPQVFADLTALNALYRPGPMAFIDDFTARKQGRKKISYILPELEEILGETYGVIVFQEQVMRIAVKIGGFSMAKADILRKAMGKKKKEIIDREGENFINGGVANGFPRPKVKQLWEQIVPFAEYGFNKSHSVAYAHVAYLTAYLKTHYPAHFMAAMLTSEASNTDKLSQYLVRSGQMGIEILPPDINRSEQVFTVEDGGIRFGLAAIKGVGEAAVGPMIEVRQAEGGFRSVSHYLRSLPTRTVNNKVLESLVRAGCFDQFGVSRKGLLDHLEQFTELAAREREQQALGQGFLFEALPSEALEAELEGSAMAEQSERLIGEREVLGFYLTGHPLDRFKEQLDRFSDCRIKDLGERFASGADRATVGGLVVGLKEIPIKKSGPNQGRKMAVFSLEGAGGALRAVVFPDVYDSIGHQLENDRAVLVAASLKGDGEHVELTVEGVVALDSVEMSRAAAIRISLDLDAVNESVLGDLRELLLAHSGKIPVRFDLVRKGVFSARFVPPAALTVDPTQALRAEIEGLIKGTGTELEFSGFGKPGDVVPIVENSRSKQRWVH
jgi:DNA polymerase-3 subunit alpha